MRGVPGPGVARESPHLPGDPPHPTVSPDGWTRPWQRVALLREPGCPPPPVHHPQVASPPGTPGPTASVSGGGASLGHQLLCPHPAPGPSQSETGPWGGPAPAPWEPPHLQKLAGCSAACLARAHGFVLPWGQAGSCRGDSSFSPSSPGGTPAPTPPRRLPVSLLPSPALSPSVKCCPSPR